MLIGVAGAKRSGKDTVGDFLCEHHGYERLSFAQPLKDMLRCLYREVGLSEDEIEDRISGSLKDKPDPKFIDGVQPRHLMVTLGTEWGREQIADQLWYWVVQRKVEIMRAKGIQKIVITDVRFANELAMIKNLGGITAVVRRKTVEPRMDRWTRFKRFVTGRSIHPSETLWTKTALFDHVLDNNGDLRDLHYKIINTLWITKD